MQNHILQAFSRHVAWGFVQLSGNEVLPHLWKQDGCVLAAHRNTREIPLTSVLLRTLYSYTHNRVNELFIFMANPVAATILNVLFTVL